MNITTVTQRIKQIKQPPRGYLPIQKFRVEILPTNKRISSSQEHGVSPQITGIVVQYLTQRVMDPVMSTSEIFFSTNKGLQKSDDNAWERTRQYITAFRKNRQLQRGICHYKRSYRCHLQSLSI